MTDTPSQDRTLRDALARIAQVEALIHEAVARFEDDFRAEVGSITLAKTASGNVRVQRTIAVTIEVRL